MCRWICVPIVLGGLLIASGCSSPAKSAEARPVTVADETVKPHTLIPRSVLFGNPERRSPAISADGQRLAWLAPRDGIMNVWVAPTGRPDRAQPVTKDSRRTIRAFRWAFDNKHILYTQDAGGDENWHVYATNVDNGETRDLTPFPNVAARIDALSHRIPGQVVIALNDREPALHDLYRVDIATGERKTLMTNTGYLGFSLDDDFNVRLGTKMTPDGGMQIVKFGADGSPTPFRTIAPEDTLSSEPQGFDKSGQILFMIDSSGRDTAALTAVNIATGESKVLMTSSKADINETLIHPTENTMQAASSNFDRPEWQFADKAVKSDFKRLENVADGDISVISRTIDDGQWIVAFTPDNGPQRYYRYDRKTQKAHFLFTNRPALEGVKLARMHPRTIRSRDGFNLISYLSLPPGADPDANGKPDGPLPMVLLVHGGPWGRDEWGFNPLHQWLANRGYAVLSVNFRGSTGLGKKFINAANKEWAGKMHDDLIDAVDWAIEKKIADPARVAIMGGSYGGYATLVGLTFTPEKFACGVDIVGPSNIVTLLESIPPYWKPMLDMFTTRVGDHRTPEGRTMLTERSPLTHVDKIRRPLLIGQGANDPRVKQAESDQIVKAMTEKSIPVTYVLYPDEGHGFARPENNMSFWAVSEAFLAQHLGGKVEPIGGDFKNSSITVQAGAERIPGLSEALREAHQ